MWKTRQEEAFLKKALLGFLIGLAVIVPGISGSAIAILFRLYDKILYAIANFRKEFRQSTRFLFPIFLGAVLGLVLGFLVLQQFLSRMPFAVVSLFAGLMLGSIPSLKDEIESTEKSRGQQLYTGIGLILPILLACGSILLIPSSSTPENRLTLDIVSVFLYLVLGFVVAITQLVPGCSATSILMATGYFIPILNSFHLDYIRQNPSVLLVYICLFVGFIVGCAFAGKALNALLKRYRSAMHYGFIGLSLGSVICLFLNPDMLAIYREWISSAGFPLLDIVLGIGLFICGMGISYELVLYMRRKNEKELRV